MKSQFLSNILNKGTQYSVTGDDTRRVRLLTVILLIALILVFPTAISQNIMSERFPQVWVTLGGFLISIISLVLNWKGHNQLANYLMLLMTMVVAISAIYFSDTQVASPYSNFIIALGSIYVIKHRLFKHFFIVLALVLFYVSNTYQLANLPFDAQEYIPLIPLLILFYVGILFSDSEIKRYQKKIELQVQTLTVQNTTIKNQAEALRDSEAKRHEQELLLKQKDLDTLLANFSFQEKVNDRVINQLSKSLKSSKIDKEIRAIINELKTQTARIDKQSLLQANMEEVNASLYARLLKSHPSLTKSELELCALIRLGLSVKEVALFRGSTPNSTMVLRSRLRKKLKLEAQSLSIYLINF